MDGKSKNARTLDIYVRLCEGTLKKRCMMCCRSGVEISEFLHENGEEVQKISYEDKSDFKQKIMQCHLDKVFYDENSISYAVMH